MNRTEFFEWLSTCPGKQIQEHDDYGTTTIRFVYKEEKEGER